METPPRTVQPVSMDSLENPRTPLAAEPNKAAESQPNIQDGLLMPSDAPSSSQDIGGMMKIVPSELDVSFTCVTVGMIFQPELICLGFCFFFVLFFHFIAELKYLLLCASVYLMCFSHYARRTTLQQLHYATFIFEAHYITFYFRLVFSVHSIAFPTSTICSLII